MNKKGAAAIPAMLVLGTSLVTSSAKITVRSNPEKIVGAGSSVIAVKVTDGGNPTPNQAVTLEVVDGHECGSFGGSSTTASTTRPNGTAPAILFKGAEWVESCVARIRVTIDGPASGGAPPVPIAAAETTVTVNPASALAKLDGISAIALVLVVSFAIDRLVRGLFFSLSYWKPWARSFPDPDLDDSPRSARAERNRTLMYFVIAGALGIIALGWFGNVRLLAALGFTAVNPVLDTVVTGLILMGGAERTEQILKSIGASGSHGPASQAAPLEVRGRLTLIIDEQGRKAIAAEPENPSREA